MEFSINNADGEDVEINRMYRPPVHPVTLSFDSPDLNRKFSKYSAKRSLVFVRVSLVLAIVLYIAFAWLDPYIIPDVSSEMLVIRVLSCLIFAGATVLTYTRLGIRHFQLLMSLVVVLGGVGIITMTQVSEATGGFQYYAGLILAVMYAHSLLRLRFIYATVTTWLVLAGYVVTTTLLDVIPFEILLNNVFFLVSSNIIGMFASFWIEYYFKSSFWKEQILYEKSDDLKREYMRKSNELRAARKMQINMLPQNFPYSTDYQFSFSMSTASEVGGDYYDYRMIDESNLTFGIGDATGHGLQASVMVTAIKLLFSEHAGEINIVDFLKRASNSIRLMGFRKLYMAFAIGRLVDDTLELAGAGMPPALVYRSKTGSVEQVSLKGAPLGGPGDFPYKKVEMKLEPGDAVLLMTDGFPELFDRDGEMLGYSRVVELFSNVARHSPETVIDYFKEEADKWLDGKDQEDDMTFFVFKRIPVLQDDQESGKKIPGQRAAGNVGELSEIKKQSVH